MLVDEAETHLHYDAQADLIDVLMRQSVASKVVYTTHSVGCLPPDLGCGVRAILPEPGLERSRIVNSYWAVEPGADDRIGYTPLLFAMGARLLSLTVPRYAVVVEGPSDAVLLPSLLREATGLARLPYRVVPGLSDLPDRQAARVCQQGGQVVCLTDGDDEGVKKRRKLESAGIGREVLFSLGSLARGCTLEDIVKPGVFAAAVNKELDTWGIGAWRIEASDVPKVGRWSWLQTEGQRTGTAIDRLNKVRVAQRVVDQGRPESVTERPATRLGATVVRRLQTLHRDIATAMGIGESS